MSRPSAGSVDERVNQTLPNMLLIGAQKCGTSWLHWHLGRHPEVFMAPVKDSGHFFWEANRKPGRQQAFRDPFDRMASQHRILGESTTTYFWTRTGSPWDRHPDGAERDVPARIREELGGNVKFLLCLRDPADRALSAFIHYVRAGELDITTPVMEAGSHNGIIDMGFYAVHLAHWYAQFNRAQFLVLNFEQDIRTQPEQTLARVFAFLGVGSMQLPSNVNRAVLPGWRREWRQDRLWVKDDQGRETAISDWQTVDELSRIYRADVAGLADLLGRDFIQPWQTVNSLQ